MFSSDSGSLNGSKGCRLALVTSRPLALWSLILYLGSSCMYQTGRSYWRHLANLRRLVLAVYASLLALDPSCYWPTSDSSDASPRPLESHPNWIGDLFLRLARSIDLVVPIDSGQLRPRAVSTEWPVQCLFGSQILWGIQWLATVCCFHRNVDRGRVHHFGLKLGSMLNICYIKSNVGLFFVQRLAE